MSQNELQHLELLCQAFYGEDNTKRQKAQDVLQPMAESIDYIPQWQSILAQSNSLQALLFATAVLNNLYTQHWENITTENKEKTREFLLNYLFQRGPDLLDGAPEILGHLIRFLCRIVQLSWVDDIKNQTIVEQVNHFLQSSTSHWIIGLHIYSSLTQDMRPQVSLNMPRYRRIAISFRDTALIDIFKIAIVILDQYHSGVLRVPNSIQETKLLKQILQLTLDCLSYDFMASLPDETTEEQHTIIIPHNWAILKQHTIPKLFFDIYEECWKYGPGVREDCARICLSVLVLIAALRRSFFGQNEVRKQIVAVLIEGTSRIVQNQIGLHNDDCYHELCRLIGKINSSSKLSELFSFPSCNQWIEDLYQFTITSMEDWRRLPNSKHYLLKFWSNMITTVINVSDVAPPFYLENYIEQVTISFIMSRLNLAESFTSEFSEEDDNDNPLNNDVVRIEQMDSISELGRCHFKDVAEKVCELFEELEVQMQNQACSQAMFQEKATWLVYIIGALIGGHNSGKFGSSSEEKVLSDIVTGKICFKVFNLMQQSNRYPECIEKLELAYIYFLEQFRKVYIEIHARNYMEADSTSGLLNTLGASTENDVLDLMVKQIGFNLQNRASVESIIKHTLNFFHSLATGINMIQSYQKSPHFIITGKHLLQNSTAKLILENHADPRFTFCSITKYGKYRTSFKFTLFKLLLLDIKLDKSKFEKFLAPLGVVFEQLWQHTQGGTNIQNLRTEQCRFPIIGLSRDLRGISEACDNEHNYTLFFTWMMEKQTPNGEPRLHLFNWAIDVWWDDSDVCNSILKFMAEFVHNKTGRIKFQQISARGVLLVREVSAMHMNYGSRILAIENFTDKYKKKYKTIATALLMFYYILSGDYIMFDYFEVYSDKSLTNSLKLCLDMCLAIPHNDLQAYIKSLKSYYLFLDLATKNFMSCFIEISPASFAELLKGIEDGLCSFEPSVFMNCCTFIENTITYILNKKDINNQEGQWITTFLENDTPILKRILQLLFQLIITGEKQRLWTISGPVFGLILLFSEEFREIQQNLILQQTDPEKKIVIEEEFNNLMSGIEPNISDDNKKLFKQNLYRFSTNYRSALYD